MAFFIRNNITIYTADQASSNTNSYTDLGYSYSAPSRYREHMSTFTQTFLGSTYCFQADEVESFYETT